VKFSLPDLASRWIGFGPTGPSGRLVSNSGTVFILTVASGAVGLITQLVLTRGLGANEYGLYAVAISWCLALAAPAMAGLDGAILRFAPRYISNGEGAQLRRFAEFTGAVQIATIVLFGLAFLLTPLGTAALSGLDNNLVPWLILFLGSTAFLGSFSSFFIAFQRFGFAQLYQNFVRPILLMGLFAAIGWEKVRLNANNALIITALSSVAALALLLAHVTWALRRFGATGEALIQPRAWLTFGWWAQFGSIGQQAVIQLPVILLGALSTPEEAGHYAIASRLAMLVTLGLSAVGAASAPMISSACGRQDWEEVAHLSRVAARISTAISVLAFLLFVLGGEMILSLFGESFKQAYVPLVILLLGACFAAFSGVNVILLSMTDQPRFAVFAILTGAAVNLSVGYQLIPGNGALGAAAGFAIGSLVSNLLMSLKIWSTHGLDSTAMGLSRETS
jgi:O-antigen/teichoic acid export membrane protein